MWYAVGPLPNIDVVQLLTGILVLLCSLTVHDPMAGTFDRLRPYGFLILYGLMLTGMLITIIWPPASLLLSWLL